jgi:hypothetical protein
MALRAIWQFMDRNVTHKILYGPAELTKTNRENKNVKYIITFMVLYSIIKPFNSFFVINRHIARQDFILNDLFSGGRNPGKILKCTSQTFSTSVAMTSHKNKQKVAQKCLQTQANLHTSN